MRIAVHTANTAVAEALYGIIQQAGHTPASPHELADLTLCDCLHPAAAATPGGRVLTLMVADMAITNADAIACPVSPQSLVQRLRLEAHRTYIPLNQGWSLDIAARALQHRHLPGIALTEKEVTLLHALAQAAPESREREGLLQEIWSVGDAIDTHTLETHIYRLRQKLAECTPRPCDILTREGAYLLALDARAV